MWWRAEQSGSDRSAHHALAKLVFVAVFLALGLAGNPAEACPEGKQFADRAAVAHKSERALTAAVVIVSGTPARFVARLNNQPSGGCCGSGCHSHGVGCISGCCFAGVASPNSITSALFLPTKSGSLCPCDQAEAASARPPPEFRPPKRHLTGLP